MRMLLTLAIVLGLTGTASTAPLCWYGSLQAWLQCVPDEKLQLSRAGGSGGNGDKLESSRDGEGGGNANPDVAAPHEDAASPAAPVQAASPAASAQAASPAAPGQEASPPSASAGGPTVDPSIRDADQDRGQGGYGRGEMSGK